MARGAIHRVWADYGVTVGGRQGIMIHASISITERRLSASEPAALIYWFYCTDDKPIPGRIAEYTDSGGNACAFGDVAVSYPGRNCDDFTVFVPYEALNHQASGSFSAYANAGLFEGDTSIAWSPEVLSFTLTMQDTPDSRTRRPTGPRATGPKVNEPASGSETPAQRYRRMFGIPSGADRAQIKHILDREYQKYRARVNSPDLAARQEADRMIVEIGKARRTLLP